MKIMVWTVAIMHRHGQDIHVAASEDAAEEIVAQFCRDWWDEIHPKEPCAAFEAQHGRKALIEHYFDRENELGGSETADIERHQLEVSR